MICIAVPSRIPAVEVPARGLSNIVSDVPSGIPPESSSGIPSGVFWEFFHKFLENPSRGSSKTLPGVS